MFKWWSTLLVIIPFILIVGLLFFLKGLHSFFQINGDLPDNITNTFDLVSWLFGGIMSLLGFITLFIAFSYENKLLIVSRIKQQILRPYALSLEEIILNFSEYKTYLTKDFLLNFIYWIFVTVSSVSIFTWGIIICLYTNFDFNLSFTASHTQIVNVVVLTMWSLLSFVLISITILLNLIRFNKDPLEKGYLLNERQLADIQRIIDKNGDLQELLFKISPTITLLKNPQQENTGKYELNIYFPIKLKNVRFVAKVYNEDNDVSLRVFGILQNVDNIGESFYHIFTNELTLTDVELDERSTGILKFYSKDNQLISLIKLKVEKNNEDIIYKSIGKMDLKLITNDNDYRDIENRNDEFLDYST